MEKVGKIRINMRLLYNFIVPIIISICSCSWVRTQNEKYYWHQATSIISSAAVGHVLENCYRNKLEMPKTVYNKNMVNLGEYDPSTKTVTYRDETFLVHEFIHAINWTDPPSYECLEQLSAVLGQRVYYLQEELKDERFNVKRLKRQVRR